MAENNETGRRGMRSDFAAIGGSGLPGMRSGYIRDEFLPALTGLKGARVYREMADNDPVCGAVLFAIGMLLRQVRWDVQAADDSKEAEEAANFAESLLADMDTPISDVIADGATMFIYGFAPLEIVYKRRAGMGVKDPALRSWSDDGKIGIQSLALRAQETVVRWEFDDAGRWTGMVQQTEAASQVTIPRERIALFRTQAVRGNPEGRSLLRNAYRSWLFKKRIEEIEGIGLERDLAGYPVVRIPSRYMLPDADPAEVALFNAYKDLASKIRRDASEGVVLPSDSKDGRPLFDIQLLSAGGTRQFDTSKIIDRYGRMIATSVLADFIFLGQGSTGSFALSSDKTELFATAVGGFLQSIASVLNEQVLARVWALNGLTWELMPTIAAGDLEKPDIGKLGAFVQAMAGAGATLFPDRDLENSLRAAAGLPPAPEDSEDDTEGQEAPEPPDDEMVDGDEVE